LSMKKIIYLLILVGLLQIRAGAITFFKDVPPNHPAYDSVYNLAVIYKVISTEESYFRGQDEITRFQFAVLLYNTLNYLERVSDKSFSGKPLEESFEDVPKDHWAYGAVNKLVNNYNVMGGYSDGTFKGNRLLIGSEMASALGKIFRKLEGGYKSNLPLFLDNYEKKDKNKTISRYEIALAVDMLIQKGASKLFVSLPRETRNRGLFEENLAAFEIKWGGVQEKASQTDNWMAGGVAFEALSPFALGRREARLYYKLGFETGKMVYLDQTSSHLVYENRFLMRLFLDVPVSLRTAFLGGLEYVSLGNSFSPSSFFGLSLGIKLMPKRILFLTPEIMLTYGFPLSQPVSVASKLGPPLGRVYGEICNPAPFLGDSVYWFYAYENLQMGENREPRLYQSFGVKLKF